MAIESGGGSSRSPYAALTQVLRSLLGSLYDGSVSDLRDEAVLNMARLQIIAPPSAEERELVAQATPDDLRPWYEHTLLNHGGRTLDERDVIQFGGVEQSFNDMFAGIEAQVRDDNIDRTTVDELIAQRQSGGGLQPPGAGDRDPRPSDLSTAGSPTGSGGGGGSVTTAGGGGGGGSDIWSTQDSSLPEAGTARQIPGGEQLWHVDGKVYLVYENPEHDGLYMYWHVENPDRLNAIYGGSIPAFDREMSDAEFKKLSPWRGGLSAELQNTSEDPWTQFNSDFREASKLRPWLNDPTIQAVMMGSYLEGRAPTQDELSQTDWWNEHTAEERAWLEQSVTMGRSELARQREDATRQVSAAMREAGISNVPNRLARFIAEQRLTGKWSESYTSEQIRKLADPFAPGRLDGGIKDLLDGAELDTTRKFEDQVRSAMEEWLGPDLGRFSDEDVAKWAGRMRNDPDAAVELEETLRQQRQVILPGYNENLTYRQIITPVENLATQVWGRPVQDSAFLVDLANTMDYSEIAKRLRTEGRKKGVKKVVEDALAGLGQTALGEQVVQSAV